MASTQQLEAATAADGWPLFRLGEWLVRPSTVLRRQRKESARIFFLLPPSGFTGTARLGVTDSRGRREFFQSWRDGRHRAAPTDASGMLDLCYDSLAGGPAGDAAFGPRWPMIFTARLAGPHRSVHADLLLEIRNEVQVSGTLILPPLRSDAGTLQLLPIVPPPPRTPGTSADVIRPIPTPGLSPPAVPAPSTADGPARALIDTALRKARHEPSMRMALPGDWAPALLAPAWAQAIRELAGQGRLDLLVTPDTDAAALRALALPFPPQVGLRVGETGPVRRLSDLRALLTLPFAGPAACGSSDRRAADRPLWSVDSSGAILVLAMSQWIRGGVFGRGREAYACAVCDWAMRRAVRIEQTQPGGTATPGSQDLPPGAQAPASGVQPVAGQHFLACLPVCLDRREDWKHLCGDIRRWNHAHASPQLQAVTPSDYFAQLAQLHEEGSIRLAGLEGPPESPAP